MASPASPISLDFSLLFRISSFSQISALTHGGKFHILAPSRIYPRGWGRIWGFAVAKPQRTTKRTTAGMDASGTLRTYYERPTYGRKAVAIAERPIAPGKVSCPKPPWDTAFPGAFFARLPFFPGNQRKSERFRPDVIGTQPKKTRCGGRNHTARPANPGFMVRLATDNAFNVTPKLPRAKRAIAGSARPSRREPGARALFCRQTRRQN